MDALIAAYDELKRSVLTPPPHAYRARLIAQIVLASILVAQCAIYLVIWVRDARRLGKNLKVIHLQKTLGGPMVTVQALCAYTVCTLLTGIMIIIDRRQTFDVYFRNGTSRHAGAIDILTVSFSSLGTLAYTFSNFNATLLLMTSTTFNQAGRTWVILYNVAFGIAVLGWIAAVIFIGIDLDPAMHEAFISTRRMLASLEAVITNPASYTPTAMQDLQKMQALMQSTTEKFVSRSKDLITVTITYSSFFAVAGAFSLGIVYMLRKQMKRNRNYLQGQYALDSAYGSYGPTSPANVGPGVRPVTTTFTSRRGGPIDRETASLEKLAADLTLSVPVVLCLAIYYPIAGGIAMKFAFTSGWTWEEFRNDYFIWPQVTMNNIILSYFLYNSWRSPGRYGVINEEEGDNVHHYGKRGFSQGLELRYGTGVMKVSVPLSLEEEASMAKVGKVNAW